MNYPLQEILLILIVAGGAIFCLYKTFNYIKAQMLVFVEEKHDELELPKRVGKLETTTENQQALIDLLVESDRNRIKCELLDGLEKHQAKGYIDFRNWEALHQKFDIYSHEGGNSWAKEVMKEIDSLERRYWEE